MEQLVGFFVKSYAKPKKGSSLFPLLTKQRSQAIKKRKGKAPGASDSAHLFNYFFTLMNIFAEM